MPNYSLIVDPKFTPMTLEQQIAPLVAYREMWDNQNKEISNLQKNATEASLLLGPNDEEEKEAYEAYRKDIEAAADRLNKVGYDAESERILRNAKNVFARDITPIVTAAKIREEEVNSQVNTLASNPFAKFAMLASGVSLSTYREDPTFRANKYFVDATKVRDAVENMAKDLTKQIIAEKGQYYDVLEKIPGVAFKFNMLRHKGFTLQDLLSDNEILDFILNAAVDPINANIDAWDRIDDTTKENIKNWVRDIAKQGLTKSIGDQLIEPVTNEYGMQSALENQRYQHALNEINLRNAQPDDDDTAGGFMDHFINQNDKEYAEKFNEIKEKSGDKNSPRFKFKKQITKSPLTGTIENPIKVNQEYQKIVKFTNDVYKALNTGKYNKGTFKNTVTYLINHVRIEGNDSDFIKKAIKQYVMNSFLKGTTDPKILYKRNFDASDFKNTFVKIKQSKEDYSMSDEDCKWLAINNKMNNLTPLEKIEEVFNGGKNEYSRNIDLPYEVQSGDKAGSRIYSRFMGTLSDLGQKNSKAKKQGWFDFGEENNPVVWTVENGDLVGKATDDVIEKLGNTKYMDVVLVPQLLTENDGYKIGFKANNGVGTYFVNALSLGPEIQNAVKECQEALNKNINEEQRKGIIETYSYIIEKKLKEHTQTKGDTSDKATD